MRKLLLILVLMVAVAAGSLSAPQQADARWPWSLSNLCAIKNPPDKVVWSGGRLFARVETRCKRRVPVLTAVACLQRFASMDQEFPVTPSPRNPLEPITQCRTAYAYGDNHVVATVSHVCDYTTYSYFWRVQGFAAVSDPQVKTTYKSVVVNSPRIIAICE